MLPVLKSLCTVGEQKIDDLSFQKRTENLRRLLVIVPGCEVERTFKIGICLKYMRERVKC